MQIRNLFLIIFISLGASQYNVSAQETIPAAGGNAILPEGSVSYSVGQVVYNTHAGTSGSLAEGVQQPYEISVVTGIQEFNDTNLLVSAYPNPANDYLTLRSDNSNNHGLTYSLYSTEGKLLINNSIEGNETNIPLGELRSAVYFLKVCNNHNELKTFKIVKN